MRAFFIAVGIGFTAWCFLTHQPLWVCVVNLGLDVLLILQYLKGSKS